MPVDAHMIDVIIGLIVLEAFGVSVLRAVTGRGPAILPFLCNLLAGAFLFLALRSALAGAPTHWVASCLLAALAAHLADLAGRWDAPRNVTGNMRRAVVSARMAEPKSRHAPSAQKEESSDV